MKLSLLCQHQGLFPTVIMVGPHFEQRQIWVWTGLPHQLVPITAQRPFAHDYELHFFLLFLIGNQKYPHHLWLTLDPEIGYLMVRGWQGWSLHQFKDLFDPKPDKHWQIKSSRLQPTLPHRSHALVLLCCQSSTCTYVELMKPSTDARAHQLYTTFLTLLFKQRLPPRQVISCQHWAEKNLNSFWLDSAQHLSKTLK